VVGSREQGVEGVGGVGGVGGKNLPMTG